MTAGFMTSKQLEAILAAAIGAGNFALILVDMQKHAGMTKRPTTAIAFHFEGIYFNNFKWFCGRSHK